MTNGFVGHVLLVMVGCIGLVCGCTEDDWAQSDGSRWMVQQRPTAEAESRSQGVAKSGAVVPESVVVDGVSDPEEAERAREQVLAFVKRLERREPEAMAVAMGEQRKKPYYRDGRKLYPLQERSFTGEGKPGGGGEREATDDTEADDIEAEMLQALAGDGVKELSVGVSPNVALSVDDVVEPVRRPRITKVGFRVPDHVVDVAPADQETTPNRGVAKVAIAVHATLADYIEQLVTQVEAESANMEIRWRLALLYAATGDHEKAVSLFEELPVGTATVMTGGLDLLSGLRSMVVSPARGADEVYAAADRLRSAAATKASLEVPTVRLCLKVNAFAVYEELPTGILRPGRANQVILYFEVENFKSELQPGGRYRSLLSSQVEIMSPSGDVLWRVDEPKIEDLARRVRRDFFVANKMVIPATLVSGEYVLKLTVEDKLAGKRTQAIHPFSVGDKRLSAANTLRGSTTSKR